MTGVFEENMLCESFIHDLKVDIVNMQVEVALLFNDYKIDI